MPRIEVLSPAGLHHHASGFHAWGPGPGEFSDHPLYTGWLAGQIERGACRVVPAEPLPEPAPEVAAIDVEAEAAVPLTPPAVAAALTVGQPVLFTNKGGKASRQTVRGLNEDGSVNLGGLLKRVPLSQVSALSEESQ